MTENHEKSCFLSIGEFLIEPVPSCLRIEVEKLVFSKDSVEIVTIEDVVDWFNQADKIVFADKDREITFTKEVKTQK
jgi:hypothetical protein